jgi:DNA-binding NarL/FixJ family response regulator
MSTNRNSKPIHVGLVANEPIWLAGMVSVFDSAPENGLPEMVPVTGTLQELLSGPAIEYLLLDLHSSSAAVEMLGFIRRTRPDLRILVIGPEGNDELVLDSIIAGARAYLDLTAGPEMVRTAISSVTEGSIWAPRRLLSKLIDRLLNGRDTSLTNRSPHLTAREGQVLELILHARSNREIASQLGIEERTVKSHVGRLMRKAGVDNRIELSMHALSHSMVADSSPRKGRNGCERSHVNS